MKALHNLYSCILVILLSAASLPAQSQGPEKDGPLTLTVDQAIELGLKYSKGLKISAEKVEAADAKALENDTLLRPSLKFSSSYTRLSKVPPFEIEMPVFLGGGKVVLNPSLLDSYNLQLTAQQPLFTGFQLSSLSKIGHLQAKAALEDLSKDQAELVFSIRSAYWNVYKAVDIKRLVDENVGLVEAHLQDVRNFSDQGLAKQNDVLKVQVQLSSVKMTQLRAANGIRLASMALNSLIGLPVMKEIAIASAARPEPSDLAPLDTLVDRALERRPETKALDFQIQAARAGIRLANAARYPQVFIVGNYYLQNPNQRIFPIENKFNKTWDVSLAVSLDLWNWNKTGHQVRQARAQLAQAENGASEVRDGIVLEVSQNYFALDEQRKAITLAADGVSQAEENFRVTRDRFKAGLALNSDLLDAEVALLEAKINHSQALADCEVLQAKLAKSVDSEGR
jgi:outer membrane protein